MIGHDQQRPGARQVLPALDAPDGDGDGQSVCLDCDDADDVYIRGAFGPIRDYVSTVTVTADPEIVAWDLVGQAEAPGFAPASPACLAACAKPPATTTCGMAADLSALMR